MKPILALSLFRPSSWWNGLPGTLAALALVGCGEPAVPTSPRSARSSSTPALASVPAINAQKSEAAVLAKSVFHAGPEAGRDPFFPGSSRNPGRTSETASVARLPLVSYLHLVGVRPGTTRPMALINKTALAPGEEGEVTMVITNQLGKAEVQKVNIRCLEIRHDSVLINIAGERGVKELRIALGK